MINVRLAVEGSRDCVRLCSEPSGLAPTTTIVPHHLPPQPSWPLSPNNPTSLSLRPATLPSDLHEQLRNDPPHLTHLHPSLPCNYAPTPLRPLLCPRIYVATRYSAYLAPSDSAGHGRAFANTTHSPGSSAVVFMSRRRPVRSVRCISRIYRSFTISLQTA